MSLSDSASILVVDDARINRLILESGLEEEGYRITSAENGREALDLLFPSEEEGSLVEQPRYDAIILDIMMPEIDGIEVLKQARKHHSSIDLPVIMATAKDQSEDVIQALEAGANDYITKPVDLPVLLARLRTHLKLKRSHSALQDMQRSMVHAAKMETIGHLAAGVAHEIRNPLAQMQMAADGIANMKALKEIKNAQMLSALMTDAIEKADVIVRRLMEFSETAKLKLENGYLNRLVEDVLAIVDSDVAMSKVEVRMDLSEDDLEVRMAPTELQQALLNILRNSLQAMAKEGGTVTIRTGQRLLEGLPIAEGHRSGNHPRNGDTVGFIEIIDTGPGISEDIIDSVFDAFVTTKPAGSGTGVGLTIAHKVINLHEGLIDIENRSRNSGVRVTILLKLKSSLATTV